MEKHSKYIEYENTDEYYDNEILEEEEKEENYMKLEQEEERRYIISLNSYESIKKYINENCLPIGEFLSRDEFYSFINR